MRILIVEDDDISMSSLSDITAMLGHEPVPCKDALAALERCAEAFYPTIITDIRMPGMDGLELLRRIKDSSSSCESDVIVITGHGDVEMAITALRGGAYDFLRKPLDVRELAAAIERSAEHQSLRHENRELSFHCDRRVEEAVQDLRRDLDDARNLLRRVAGIGQVVAASPSMKRILADARLYHENPDVPVLIEGETGTGKEIVARLIHFGDMETDASFVDINCSAIAENLFESELFGYEAGAFTGSSSKGLRGKIESANGGTLFLDEIGDLPLAVQPKLLRVLEDRTFYRVGGLKRRSFEGRIVCATNRNLQAMVEEGSFRRDLFHRLKIGYISIPPLRERRDDVPALATLFLKAEAGAKKKLFQGISSRAMELLLSRQWLGNVRELKNAIERAVLVHDGLALQPEHLDFLQGPVDDRAEVGQPKSLDALDVEFPDEPINLDEFIEGIKRRIVMQAVERFGQNKSKAAEFLGWDRNKIYRLLGK
ncbi:MAG: sigma-54 dependent transcriptional regulator [Thermodesulfobacteriota bacterium]